MCLPLSLWSQCSNLYGCNWTDLGEPRYENLLTLCWRSSSSGTNVAVKEGNERNMGRGGAGQETIRTHFWFQMTETFKFTALWNSCKEYTWLESLDIKLSLVILVLGQIRITRQLFFKYYAERGKINYCAFHFQSTSQKNKLWHCPALYIFPAIKSDVFPLLERSFKLQK